MSSQAVLLKEYKALSKEKWVEIEVRTPFTESEIVANEDS
jgi:hypothetical protein